MDHDRRRYACCKLHILGHVFQRDAHGNALRETYPLEVRVYRGQLAGADRGRVGDRALMPCPLPFRTVPPAIRRISASPPIVIPGSSVSMKYA